MEIDATADDFAKWIAEAIRAEVVFEDDEFVFHLRVAPNESSIDVWLKATELNDLIAKVREKDEREETALTDERKYEVLIKEHSNYGPRFLFRRDKVTQEDTVNDISYRLSSPSDEYLIFFLYKISRVADVRSVLRGYPRRRMMRYIDEQEGELDIYDLLRFSIPRLITLHLASGKTRGNTEFARYADAFLFQISYNRDVALVPQRYLEEIVRSGRITRSRRSRVEEIEAPRRHFETDLIYHYQMGVASDNPSLEFLSYYHVAEHFFEAVFNDDLINQVKEMITLPDFSYRRKNDIRKLIWSVTKRIKLQNETVTFSEQEALKLTLKKYVDLQLLKEQLTEYDESLIEYHRTTEVAFSNGPSLNLEDEDSERALSSAATRIYRTRNAIVHSKEGERGKYIPFQHDRALVKEVPLLRFVAELIIIETSRVIGA